MDKPINTIAGPFTTLPLPESKMRSVHELHKGIIEAANKGEIIAEFMKHGSQHGWFSNAPPEMWEKLKKATSKNQSH